MGFHELPPKIKSRYHYITNGIIWTGAGINLMINATGWLSESETWLGLLTGFITFSLGIILSKTRFKKIAGKFITHIRGLPDNSWFFAFQARRHYILLITMMLLGISLRKFSGIDIFYLSIIYMIMGTTLFFTSYYFFQRFLLNHNPNSDNID